MNKDNYMVFAAKMSSIKQPVVWCSDPNSSNQKPTAFALHGIQFEGNVTEQHMLVLREIINAAAEGRLLLPSNGTIVLLDCDSSENSPHVPSLQQTPPMETTKTFLSTSEVRTGDSEENKSMNGLMSTMPSIPMDVCEIPHGIEQHSSRSNTEPKYSEFDLPELNKYDFIYEFLCCAKCINKLDKDGHREHLIVCSNDIHRIGKKQSFDSTKIEQQQEYCNGDDMSHTVGEDKYQMESSERPEPKVMPLYATVKSKSNKKIGENEMESDPNTENSNFKCAGEHITGQLLNDCVRDVSINKLDTTVMSEVPTMDEQSDLPFRNDLQNSNDVPDETIDLCGVQLRSSRKTSLDSSCTVGSMDSGFIEMQNKLEANGGKEVHAIKNSTENSALPSMSPQISVSDGVDEDANAEVSLLCTNNKAHLKENIPLKECSTQSRNRRKSYEEFKAIYHNRMALDSELPFVWEHEPNRLTVCSQTEKIKARRKSYEEFKALVSRQPGNTLSADATSENAMESDEISAEGATKSNSISTYVTVPKKKKQHHKTTATNAADTQAKKIDVLIPTSQPSTSIAANQSKSTNDIYRTNFKIYDKLMSYGTIYDIMQKKSDIYKAYRKYDAYMTYGTIYEILQRKSDDYEVFRRKRVASEKCIDKCVSLNSSESIDRIDRATKDDRSRSITFGAIYDIIQRKQRQKKSNSLPNGICAAIELTLPFEPYVPIAKASQSDRHNDGCIYDIIQTEQCDVSKVTVNDTKHGRPNVIKNRFLVEKVNERELFQIRSNDSDKSMTISTPDSSPRTHTYNEPSDTSKWNVQKTKKPKKSNRMRRFSQILSYTQHRSQAEQTTTVVNGGDTTNRIDPMSHTNNDVLNKYVECTHSKNADDADKLCLDLKSDSTHSEAKIKMNQLRKLSTPLPATSTTVQLPKIVPRKLSAPSPSPPPIPPSIDPLAVISPKKCPENVSSYTHKSKKHKITSPKKFDNRLLTSEPCTISESDSNRLKHVSNTCDDRVTKLNVKTTDEKTATRKANRPNGNPKSRRLSEFTRGEFLNEKP